MDEKMKKKIKAAIALLEDLVGGEQEEEITSLDQMKEMANKKSAEKKVKE